MSTGYLIALAAVVLLLAAARGLLGLLPLGATAPARGLDLALLALGILGLVVHCGAMFFRSAFSRIPGSGGVIDAINAMNVGSQLWYVVAAALVLIGLRRQQPIALAVLALALVAVGVTMYDGGPLRVHLTAIFVSVTVLATVLALLVRLPARRITDPAP